MRPMVKDAPMTTAPAGAFGPTDLETAPKWWVPIVVGVLAIIAGILSLAWPGPTLLLVGITFGVLLIVAGFGYLAASFRGDAGGTVFRVLEAILGVITLLAGLVLLVRPGASVVTAALVLGFWWLLAGALQLARGFAEREHRAYNIAFGILGIIAGAIIVAQPGIGVVTLVIVVGVGFLLYGALQIALGFAIRRLRPA
jgi:uncharacterized membrane protein HdeD (DUF308 family)